MPHNYSLTHYCSQLVISARNTVSLTCRKLGPQKTTPIGTQWHAQNKRKICIQSLKTTREEKREPDCGPKQSSGHTKGWGERDELMCEKFEIRREKERKHKVRADTSDFVKALKAAMFGTADANPKAYLQDNIFKNRGLVTVGQAGRPSCLGGSIGRRRSWSEPRVQGRSQPTEYHAPKRKFLKKNVKK
jgi:hypothetical protein